MRVEWRWDNNVKGLLVMIRNESPFGFLYVCICMGTGPDAGVCSWCVVCVDSQLHGDNAHLLYHVVWCLVQLCEDDPDCCTIMRQMGAIPLLLALLQWVQVALHQCNSCSNVCCFWSVWDSTDVCVNASACTWQMLAFKTKVLYLEQF